MHMADEIKPKVGTEGDKGHIGESAVKVPVVAVTDAQIEAVARANADAAALAEKVARRESARQYFESLIPARTAKPSVVFTEALAKYDPRDSRIQPAECWKFSDGEFARQGRF